MGNDEDLYAVLGVLPNAEDIVITAAYRALAARYHPDRWKGPKEIAHERMSEINRAYGILSDADKRADYDLQRKNYHQTFGDATDERSNAFDDALAGLEERWTVAVSVFPKLAELRKRLSKTSHELAFGFVTLLLGTRRFNQAEQIAKGMEQTFLERFFGTDPFVLQFARELIALGLQDAVKALNRLVDVLGSDVDASLLINKVTREFSVNEKRVDAAAEGVVAEKQRALRDKIYVLKERLPTQPYIDLARELAELLGYSVVESGGSYFRDSTIVVSQSGRVIATTLSGPDFVDWVKKTLI